MVSLVVKTLPRKVSILALSLSFILGGRGEASCGLFLKRKKEIS